jgi:hypothetical protein
MTTTARRAVRAAAREQLVRALVEAAAKGPRTHCSDAGAELCLYESEADRAQAAILCRGCPVFGPCGDAAAANRENFRTWAGVDRTASGVPGPKPRIAR